MIVDEEYDSHLRWPSRIYKKIDECIVQLYSDLNINSAPIDVFLVAKKKGYKLIPLSKSSNKTIKSMINNNADGFSYYHPELGRFVIRYNDVQCIERQRFTIMHEIGHILLGHKTESDLADKMANYFAAYALAPSPLLHEYGVEDYIDIKNIFQVKNVRKFVCSDIIIG